MKNLKLTVVVMLLFISVLALTSCATVKHVDLDGQTTEYSRVGNQQIGSLTILKPDGTMIILKGQSADNDEFIKKLAEGITEGLIKGARGL